MSDVDAEGIYQRDRPSLLCPVCDEMANARLVLNPESGYKTEIIPQYEQMCSYEGPFFVLGFFHKECTI